MIFPCELFSLKISPQTSPSTDRKETLVCWKTAKPPRFLQVPCQAAARRRPPQPPGFTWGQAGERGCTVPLSAEDLTAIGVRHVSTFNVEQHPHRSVTAEEASSCCARRPAPRCFCSGSERQLPCWNPRPSLRYCSPSHLRSALPNYCVSSSGQSLPPCARHAGAVMWVRALGH